MRKLVRWLQMTRLELEGVLTQELVVSDDQDPKTGRDDPGAPR